MGWGALANPVFGLYPSPESRNTAEEVRNLLTAEEYSSARASTPNAHFASPMVMGAIWEGLERMGVREGVRALEPPCVAPAN